MNFRIDIESGRQLLVVRRLYEYYLIQIPDRTAIISTLINQPHPNTVKTYTNMPCERLPSVHMDLTRSSPRAPLVPPACTSASLRYCPLGPAEDEA